jgi:hypothetical protein
VGKLAFQHSHGKGIRFIPVNCVMNHYILIINKNCTVNKISNNLQLYGYYSYQMCYLKFVCSLPISRVKNLDNENI